MNNSTIQNSYFQSIFLFYNIYLLSIETTTIKNCMLINLPILFAPLTLQTFLREFYIINNTIYLQNDPVSIQNNFYNFSAERQDAILSPPTSFIYIETDFILVKNSDFIHNNCTLCKNGIFYLSVDIKGNNLYIYRIRDCNFVNNTAINGGGVYIQ
jgi:hypothetical protein